MLGEKKEGNITKNIGNIKKREVTVLLSLVIALLMLMGSVIDSKAAVLTGSSIASYCNSKVESTYPSGYCLAWVASMFRELGAGSSSACCAYNYGRQHLVSTDLNNIPVGADVFFSGSKTRCSSCGNTCGHVAIYVGDGYIVHSYSGKVHKDKLSTVMGWSNYKYMGWGYHGNVVLSNVKDSQGPSYSDYHVGEIRSDGTGFTVMAKVTDTSGISSVKYAVWTEKGGQDDLKWYDGYCTDNNNYYWHRVNFADHNNEKGKYIIHMYAYDNAGNHTAVGITYDFSVKGPDCTDFHVGEFRQGAYTVLCKVTSVNKVTSVKYAVWTEKGGQDDIKWYGGNCFSDNSIYWARINFSDHNNEKGKYIIHIYAYDMAGQKTNIGITYTFPEKGPDISDIEVSDISAKGYTVKCKLTGTSSDVGISKVLFPTWTSNNGQDDIATNWMNDSSVKGTIDNNIATFRVDASEHNNETGDYITHIYAYDVFGNHTAISVPVVNVHDHVREIIKGKNATCTEIGYTDGEKCSVCGKVFKEQEVIDACGHDYNIEVIEPTLVDKGYTLHTCVICGDEYRDNYVDELTSQIENDEDAEQTSVKEDTKQSLENVDAGQTSVKEDTKQSLENVDAEQTSVKEDTKQSLENEDAEQYAYDEYAWSNDEIEVDVPEFKKLSNVRTRALRIQVAKVDEADGYEYTIAKVTTKTYKKFKKAIKLADGKVSFKGAKTYTSKTDKIKVSKLKKGKRYAVVVRAYIIYDGEKYYSGYSNVKNIAIKK